ncbi:MAG: acetyl-CoA C-acetyltransferase [Bacteroidota bacterium]
MKKVVIVSAKRTPIGSFMGKLASLKVTDLGKIVIEAVIDDSGIAEDNVDEVIMGNVLPAGVGQAPARQAALYAGLSDATECLTINKMCGSGLKAVMLADQAVKVGDAEIIIAGGMESMSNAPHLIQNVRKGYRLGDGKLSDSMIHDGLWDIYNDIHMGSCAEKCARDFSFSREDLDTFAIGSYKKSLEAQKNGIFNDEIVPIKYVERKNEIVVTDDEEPLNVKFEKIPNLRPAFDKDGVITAANASKINDGASALVVMSEEKALSLGLKPLVEIVAQASAATAPIDFSIAPAHAINNALDKTNLEISDIDIFEINEAFAVVSLAVNKLLNLDPLKVNPNGGAISLGHPIGASGARILTTLIYEMKRNDLEHGIASLCIGGGEGSALIVKNYN